MSSGLIALESAAAAKVAAGGSGAVENSNPFAGAAGCGRSVIELSLSGIGVSRQRHKPSDIASRRLDVDRRKRNTVVEPMYQASFCRLAGIFAALVCLNADSRVVLDDETVHVTTVAIPPTGEYKVESARPYGSVWVALDDGAVLLMGGTSAGQTVHAGEAAFVVAGTVVSLRSPATRPVRLIVVGVKRRSQGLTVHTTELKAGNELDDASDRNRTLLIPVSTIQLRDIRDLGDESEWKPSKPDVIRVLPGKVVWLRAGRHHFRNLMDTSSAFVTVEW